LESRRNAYYLQTIEVVNDDTQLMITLIKCIAAFIDDSDLEYEEQESSLNSKNIALMNAK
jgi:hypothetical protein